MGLGLIDLVYSFAGGIFGALIGGTNVFSLTGLVGLIGIAASLSGGGDFIFGRIAFGPFINPPVMFGGGAAALAYAAMKSRQGRLIVDGENYKLDGHNTYLPLYTLKDPTVLLVGGLFGSLGWALNHLFVNVWALPLDGGSLAVFLLNLAARLLFTDSGVFPEYPEGESRFGVLTPKYMLFTALWAFFIGFGASYVSIETGFNNVLFCISAMSLVFSGMYDKFTTTHHVTMTAGFAGLISGNVWYGAVFGMLAGILGEYVNRAINTYGDSHLDREATTITILTFIASIIAG